MLILGKKLAETYGELDNKEEEKKAVTSQLKAECDSIASRISEYQSKVMAGYEYRQTPCIVKYDTPTTGQKTILRLDSNSVVSIDQMSLAEMQSELPLQGEQTKSAGQAAQARKANADEHGVVTLPSDEATEDSY